MGALPSALEKFANSSNPSPTRLLSFPLQRFTLRHVNSNQCLDEPSEDDKMVPTMKDCNESRSQQWLLRNMTLGA